MTSHPLSPSGRWDAWTSSFPFECSLLGSICLSSTWGSRAPASSSSCISLHVIPYSIPNTCLPQALELHKRGHMRLGAEDSPVFQDTKSYPRHWEALWWGWSGCHQASSAPAEPRAENWGGKNQLSTSVKIKFHINTKWYLSSAFVPMLHRISVYS